MIKIGRKIFTLKRIDQFKGKAVVGQVDYESKTITIARRGGISGIKRTKSEMDKTLWHEVVHAVLKDMKNPLESNEKFVDEFAKRLHSMKLSGLDKK